MHIGLRIAQTRKQKNMTQRDLAKGIVSISHLSNIEGGRYHPSEDILKLFYKKLDIPAEYFIKFNSKSISLESRINELKKNIIINIQNAEESLKKIQEEYPYIYSLEQEIAFQLCYCCYLVKKGNIDKAQKIFDDGILAMTNSSGNLPEDLRELHYHYFAVLFFYKEEYGKSVNYFKKQLQFSNPEGIPHVLYNIALSFCKLGYYKEAIRYGNKSLKEHLYNSKWLQVTKAHNLLGIVLIEQSLYKEAIEHLIKGLEISFLHDYKSLTCKVLHNLGLAFTRQGDYAKGRMFLSEALYYKRKYDSSDIFITYAVLIDCLVNIGICEELTEYINEIRKYIKTETDQQLLNIKLAKVELKKGNLKHYESYMNEAITFFKLKNQCSYIVDLSREMGDYYYQLKKYKKAADYYKIEINNITNMKNIKENINND